MTRAIARERVRALAPVRGIVSEVIVEHLSRSGLWRDARAAMAYLAMPSEVDLDGLWRVTPRPVLAAPGVDWDSGTMHPVVVDDPEQDVTAGPHGVRQPAPDGKRLDPASLGFVLVPGLAFAADGARLGRGGGYYDRFLAGLPGVTRVGVCWSGQILGEIPVAPHDVRVHRLLTEQGLQECRPAGG
ncbi:MAG: 5-formyltetrahydrofolate cyclo-ligase [Phycisphaeraceae bacterium]|nr:MAG: 5-formyltetrahydrofolate cyclo-ligase [Phycisphaeraceae bacterium]